MPQSPQLPCPSLMELEVFLQDAGSNAQLARHLETCPQCRAAVEEIRANNELMARVSGTRLSVEDLQPAGEPRPAPRLSARLEGYEVHEEIHRGSQGVVYRATQGATNRIVALKVLLAGTFATSRQLRRFEREIELVAQLEHPNVVTVYDSGTTDDGCHYLAMQYVEGVPLDRWSARPDADVRDARRAPLRGVLRLFVKLCDGVSYAHQRGVIHRDLKPANVIVDAAGEPHILDFGLAKLIDEPEERGRTFVTQEGVFLGTLAYAAPEQTRGDASLIDVRSDVYSLGVILYETLTGRFPYPVEGELAEVLEAITSAAPKPPRAWQREQYARVQPRVGFKIDDELETIILKALAKEKERRYQSAAALRDDLERYLAGAPIEAKRDSGWYILKKTFLRYWVPGSVGAAFVLLLVVFSGAMLVMYQRARVEANKVRQINVFLEDTLSSVQPAQGGREVGVRDLLDEAVVWIDIALADQPEVAASIQSTIGNSYLNLGLFEEAETLLDASLRTRRDLFGEDHRQVAQSLNLLARLRSKQGRFEQAERLYEEALALQRRLAGDDRLDLYTLAGLAELRRSRQQYAEAEELLQHSLTIRRRLFGAVHADVAMGLYLLAVLAEETGDLERAEALQREALEMYRAVLHRHHSSLRQSLYTLGTLLLRTQRAAEAEALLRECLVLRRETLRPGHWQIGQAAATLGAALTLRGEYDEAEALLLESCGVLEQTLKRADDRTRQALRRLVELYDAWGKPDEAATWRQKLLTINSGGFSDSDPRVPGE